MEQDNAMLGRLLPEEENELRQAINSVINKVTVRHEGAVPEDLESALYDIQDFLECTVSPQGNDLDYYGKE